MRVFVTGASGYIGSAVVAALVRAGHEVAGMHHDPSNAGKVKRLGAMPVRGDLRDAETYQHFAAECDVTIHTALEPSPDAPSVDFSALEHLMGALNSEGGKKAFIYTSGVWVLGDTQGHEAGEDAARNPPPIVAWRPAHERRVLDGATEYVSTAVIRPGMVYGESRGFFGTFFSEAAERGEISIVGDGRNRWSCVHRDDLAELYRRVAEQRGTGIFHGVDGSPISVEAIARACCEAAGKEPKVSATPLVEARKRMGMMADALCLDQRAISRRGGEVGWQPSRRSFPDAAGASFQEWRAQR